LLELFIADSEGRRLTGADVSDACDIPPTVLSRWLKYLSKAGFVIGDGDGNLTDQLTLSGKGMESMEQAISKACDLRSLLGKTT
jgi:DNA-binding IclR family transcriptional regulator